MNYDELVARVLDLEARPAAPALDDLPWAALKQKLAQELAPDASTFLLPGSIVGANVAERTVPHSKLQAPESAVLNDTSDRAWQTSGTAIPSIEVTLTTRSGYPVLIVLHGVYLNGTGVSQTPLGEIRRSTTKIGSRVQGAAIANGASCSIVASVIDEDPPDGSTTYKLHGTGGGDGSGSSELVGSHVTHFAAVEL